MHVSLGYIILVIISAVLLIEIANSKPLSYQYVKFVRNGNGRTSSQLQARPSEVRSARNSFTFPTLPPIELTAEDIVGESLVRPVSLETNSPVHGILELNLPQDHETPDFTNGLDYHDPFLITGLPAKRIAGILYKKPLFFEEINHVESLERNQEQRRRSGLSGHILGSLRPHLPYHRFKNSGVRFFK